MAPQTIEIMRNRIENGRVGLSLPPADEGGG
jgi:hypothetical protein